MTEAHDKPEPEPESKSKAESASGGPDPLPLEQDATADDPAPPDSPSAEPDAAQPGSAEGSSHVADLDVCPNCGAPMRGQDDVLCLRCGFDLKTLEVVGTATGQTASEPESDRGERPAIVVSHWTDRRLLPALVAIVVLALVVSALAGYRGLFLAGDGDEVIAWSVRLRYVVRMLVLFALWGLCGLIAVGVGARLFERSPGDWMATLVRLLAVIVVAWLVKLIDLPNQTLEFIVELVAQAVVVVALTMALLRLKVRDAAIVVGIQATAFVALYAVAHLIVWPAK